MRKHIVALALASALAACATDREVTPSSDGGADDSAVTPGSDGAVPPGTVKQTSAAISECGGFAAKGEVTKGLPTPQTKDYCAAETLLWQHDAAKQTLRLADNRVLLNCCGDHSIDVALVDGVYVITERDAPQDGATRCRCMCVFDFATDIAPVPVGTIAVKIVREVTDSGDGPQEVFSGKLDLSAGAGAETIDTTDASTWCQGSADEPVTQTPAVSECGGFAASADRALGYCDAEVLGWSYDAAALALTLANERVLLNCCGDRSITVAQQGSTLVITETDAPEAATGSRCLCQCVFDFAVTLGGIAAGTYDFQLVRDVKDDAGGPRVVSTGKLDLAQGAGQVIVEQSDVTPWCTPPQPK